MSCESKCGRIYITIERIVPINASRFKLRACKTCCAKLFLALALQKPANIVFLVLLMFLIFQILFVIHLVLVIKYIARHVRLTIGGLTENSIELSL